MDKNVLVTRNIQAHNKVARKYEKIHGEIYNEIEQGRLSRVIEQACSLISTDSERKSALDFGCGAGNLTSHLLKYNMDVYSADVSRKFLDLIEEKFAHCTNSRSILLNGVDLSNIENDSMDLVATYSVLHHVPDYISAVREMIRVLKPGGILLIDHEHSPGFWNKTDVLKDFEIRIKAGRPISRFLNPLYYFRAVKSKLMLTINPRYQSEGDIHVFPDDHIEWDLIQAELMTCGCEIVYATDYLVYKSHYPIDVYNQYSSNCDDMTALIARKIKTL